MAKGPTWLRPTRERSSIRRSLPATSAASRNMGGCSRSGRCRHSGLPGRRGAVQGGSGGSTGDPPSVAAADTNDASARVASGSADSRSRLVSRTTGGSTTRPPAR